MASVVVDGRLDLEVEANSFEEAKDKAETAFMFASLEEMEVVGSNVGHIYCVDQNTEKDFDF